MVCIETEGLAIWTVVVIGQHTLWTTAEIATEQHPRGTREREGGRQGGRGKERKRERKGGREEGNR